LLATLIIANNAHKLTKRHSQHWTKVAVSLFLDILQLKRNNMPYSAPQHLPCGQSLLSIFCTFHLLNDKYSTIN